MEQLRAYIREVMRQKNIKGIHIEAQSGGKIKDSTVSDILSGKTQTINVDTVNALAEGLGVDRVEVFRAASGDRIHYKTDDPWPGRVLMSTMQKIMDNADLTAIVKTLVDLKPAQIKTVKKLLKLD
jgi:hypothetical protein